MRSRYPSLALVDLLCVSAWATKRPERRTKEAGHVVNRLWADAVKDGVRKDVFGMRVNYGADVWVCLQDRRVDISFGVSAYGTVHRCSICDQVLADVCWSRYHCWAYDMISKYQFAL